MLFLFVLQAHAFNFFIDIPLNDVRNELYGCEL